ncbi:cytochrome P450 [Kutzneria kofuensis]|uniref:Cytochrome P450 n=1 Tax=Kutzneria kofuensis TaxID=103725 RepID=A0A7W9KJI8_9PSEU|nr:cytochrome P450 [Kutzneria kofuensis]MBB5893773.1 cytochrome P450 [Kutzneria kofuensis]
MSETTLECQRPRPFPLERTSVPEPAGDYRRLRAEQPIIKVSLPTEQEAWLVTRYSDVRALLIDERISADRSHPNFPLRRPVQSVLRKGFSAQAKSLLALDLPEHTAPRRMLANEFTLRRINELRPVIQKIVDDRIDEMLAAGPPADLISDLATQVPSRMICELLGVPLESREFFQDRTLTLQLPGSTPEQQLQAADDLARFLDELVTEKEREPSDDVLGRLVLRNRDTEVYTHDLLVGMAQNLLIGGHETTINAIALGTIGLLQRPDVIAELQSDPDMIVATVEEILRYYPIFDVMVRVAKEDIEIGGVTIKAGDGVVLALGSCNRDEERFADGDTFDARRGDRQHVTFGYGIHQCLGQNLARVELEIVFATLFRRIPTLRLAVDLDEVPFKVTSTITGVFRLPVTW